MRRKAKSVQERAAIAAGVLRLQTSDCNAIDRAGDESLAAIEGDYLLAAAAEGRGQPVSGGFDGSAVISRTAQWW